MAMLYNNVCDGFKYSLLGSGQDIIHLMPIIIENLLQNHRLCFTCDSFRLEQLGGNLCHEGCNERGGGWQGVISFHEYLEVGI